MTALEFVAEWQLRVGTCCSISRFATHWLEGPLPSAPTGSGRPSAAFMSTLKSYLEVACLNQGHPGSVEVTTAPGTPAYGSGPEPVGYFVFVTSQ